MSIRKVKKSASSTPRPAFESASVLDTALAQATIIPARVVEAYVDSVRKRNPQATPEQIANILGAQFKNLMRTTGGAVGVTAALPAIGTTTALALSAADVGLFLSSASMYCLAIADVHGISVTDVERRKALLLTSVLGDAGAKSVANLTGKPLTALGPALLLSLPKSTIRQVNSVLTSRFVKRQLIKYTGLTAGRIIPFGVGAVVGVAGGNALAATAIHQTKRAFGPAPAFFARPLVTIIERPESDATDPAGLTELTPANRD